MFIVLLALYVVLVAAGVFDTISTIQGSDIPGLVEKNKLLRGIVVAKIWWLLWLIELGGMAFWGWVLWFVDHVDSGYDIPLAVATAVLCFLRWRVVINNFRLNKRMRVQ